MRVKPVGTLVYKKGGQEFRIPAKELSQQGMQKEAVGFQGESEDWSVIFTAGLGADNFSWYVTYTIGNEGLEINDSEITEPTGVEVTQDVSFKSA